MKKFRQIVVEQVSEIVCDRCLKTFCSDDSDFSQIQSIAFLSSYGSIFGDGMDVAIDLCPACVKEVLGPWLRVEPGPWLEDPDTR